MREARPARPGLSRLSFRLRPVRPSPPRDDRRSRVRRSTSVASRSPSSRSSRQPSRRSAQPSLARKRDRTAVSLVIVRAATDDVAEEILDAITEAAPAGSWNASSRFGEKHWLILYGVLPKRARDLAEAVLYASPSLAALMSLHGAGVGVAGFPRHAR